MEKQALRLGPLYTVSILGYPLLSIVLVAVLGADVFMSMYLNIVIVLGLGTVLGGWQWWRSRGQDPEAAEMPTGVFVSCLGYWFVLPLMWALRGPGPFVSGLRMAVLFCSSIAVVSAIFSNGYFLGQRNSRQRMLDEAKAKAPTS
ncbi:MAG: hypothetical protein P8K76_15240 [Candidatus Binatia bacterium]|nr:hypothetical protein [Candidatus Binatia bacterium]